MQQTPLHCSSTNEHEVRRIERGSPDHKTIADFRKDNGLALRKVCARFVELCREMALSVLAYNLTRVMNIVGIRPLIAAIAA